MNDPCVANQELFTENLTLKKRIQELELSCAEHKMVEQTLKENNCKFMSLASTIPGNIAYVNANTLQYEFVNDTFEKSFGIPREKIIGQHIKDIIGEENYKFAMKYIEEVRLGKSISYENTFDLVSGKRWIQVNYTPVVDAKRLVTSIAVLSLDITERKKADEALKAAEETYRNIFLNAQTGLFRTDINTGLILDVNDCVARFIGYNDREELLSKPFNIAERYVDPKDRERVLSLLKEQGQFNNFEARFRRNDDSIIWMRFAGRIVPEKNWIEGVSEDITKEKDAEKALRQTEENFRHSLDESPLGVRIVTEEGETVYANRAILDMHGYDSIDEYKKISTEQRYTTESFAEHKKRKEKRKRGDYLSSEYEISIIRKTGEVRHLQVFRKEILWDGKRQSQGICQDITDRKRAEEEKRDLQERLNHAEKMEALGTMAGGVAHDLNNVLGVVIGFSELLLVGVDEKSPLRKGLVNIMKGSERAAAIVQDLLTLARRGVTSRSILNLNKIIADNQHSPEFEKLFAYHSAVRISIDLAPDLLNISGSAVHLDKTLFNLISNAGEAMPEGGDLTIRTANQYLAKPIRGYDEVREGDYVVLSVSDTGEGIPAENLKRIFEPFFTKKVMGRSGTGLGLAVVWGTVKDHNGYINIESEEGKGSTFTMYFPVTKEELSADSVSASISEYMGNGESILVVDDVEGQRELASMMLCKLNYTVTTVSSGEEAWAYLKEHQVDLLVLDMIMDPGMDGLDTYRSVLEIHPKQKAIIVSGFSESDRVHAAHDLGAGAYVKKPYVLEKLGLAVKKELARK